MAEAVETVTEITPNAGYKTLLIATPPTTLSGDTVVVELSKYGATRLQWIGGNAQTTSGSVLVTEAPTTTCSASGLLVITIPATNTNSIRTYMTLVS